MKVAKQDTEVALEVRHNYGPQTAATVARFLLPHELGAGDLFSDLTRNQTSYYGDQSPTFLNMSHVLALEFSQNVQEGSMSEAGEVGVVQIAGFD